MEKSHKRRSNFCSGSIQDLNFRLRKKIEAFSTLFCLKMAYNTQNPQKTLKRKHFFWNEKILKLWPIFFLTYCKSSIWRWEKIEAFCTFFWPQKGLKHPKSQKNAPNHKKKHLKFLGHRYIFWKWKYVLNKVKFFYSGSSWICKGGKHWGRLHTFWPQKDLKHT